MKELCSLNEWTAASRGRKAMPALFIGHGSPMNGVEDTEFSAAWTSLGASLPRPLGIVCVSAHWLTRGPRLTAMSAPRTIHDFSGFPRALYEVSYPAPGSPELARLAADRLGASWQDAEDLSWGLDHGAWTVLRRMFPKADVPVVQLSVDLDASPERHLELGKRLGSLRDDGVLIVGSGNVVHNLGLVDFARISAPGSGYPWAVEFDAAVKAAVLDGNDRGLADIDSLSGSARLAVPAPDHYIPLLYAVGARRSEDAILVLNETTLGGSLSMTSYAFG